MIELLRCINRTHPPTVYKSKQEIEQYEAKIETTEETSNAEYGCQNMIYVWRLQDDSDEYEKIGQLTDDGEFIMGEDMLTRIYPKEWWIKAEPEMVLSRLNNGHIVASHKPPEEIDSTENTSSA